MADKRAYFKLDVGYLTNPKIAAVAAESPTAVLLHMQCIAYSAQHLTDGVVPMRLAMRLACSTQCDLDLLIEYGLLTRLNDRTVEVHDYLEHQRSAAEANKASDQAKLAATKRWAAAEGNADGNASGMPTAMPREKREREKNTSSSAAADGDFADWWKLYPRKVGKQAALKAYRKAHKQVGAQRLLEAITAQAPTIASAEPRFQPHPAKWLNDGRWDDEVPGARPQPDEQGRIALPPLPRSFFDQ